MIHQSSLQKSKLIKRMAEDHRFHNQISNELHQFLINISIVNVQTYSVSVKDKLNEIRNKYIKYISI